MRILFHFDANKINASIFMTTVCFSNVKPSNQNSNKTNKQKKHNKKTPTKPKQKKCPLTGMNLWDTQNCVEKKSCNCLIKLEL